MRADAQCRSCHAPIRWVITAANGKRMPLDPEPVADGNMWVERIENGLPVMEVALSGDGVPTNVPFRYVSHFVTCEHRDQWRKS
jgi:hypothetical protein